MKKMKSRMLFYLTTNVVEPVYFSNYTHTNALFNFHRPTHSYIPVCITYAEQDFVSIFIYWYDYNMYVFSQFITSCSLLPSITNFLTTASLHHRPKKAWCTGGITSVTCKMKRKYNCNQPFSERQRAPVMSYPYQTNYLVSSKLTKWQNNLENLYFNALPESIAREPSSAVHEQNSTSSIATFSRYLRTKPVKNMKKNLLALILIHSEHTTAIIYLVKIKIQQAQACERENKMFLFQRSIYFISFLFVLVHFSFLVYPRKSLKLFTH